MKKDLHDIDKLFKAALDDQEETPSAGVWDAIDQHLDKNSVVDINRKYTQLKKIAVALLILLLGIGAYTLSTWNKSERLSQNSKTKISTLQKNDTGLLNESPNKQDKINTPGAINTAPFTNNEISSVNTDEPIENKNKGTNPTAITTSPATTNSSGPSTRAGNEILKAAGGSKIMIKKRSQKTTITNADLGKEENETVQTVLAKEDEEIMPQLTILDRANPELIRVEQDNRHNKNIIPDSYQLPVALTSIQLPNKTMKVKKASAFTATIFYAPDFSSNHIKEENHEMRPGRPNDNRDKEKIRDGEQHHSAYTFGVLIDYKMNNHWSLQSGVSLSKKVIHIAPKTIYADVDNNGAVKYLFNCSSGYLFLSSKTVTNPVIGDSIHASESTNTLQYVSIPFGIKYNYSFNKIDLFSSVGTAVNILTRGRIETGIENGLSKEVSASNKINGLKPSYWGGNIGIGAAYNITNRIAISFTPTYNFALTSSTKDAAVKSYPNSISLAAGIRYKL